MKLGLGRKDKVAEPELEAASSKPSTAKKEKPVAAKPVRSHSKADQTRRKASARGKTTSERAPEAA